MILTCPQCATRYQTDAALFGAQGRKVRCAKCGNVWQQEAPPVPFEAEPEPARFEEIEPPVPPPPTSPPPPRRMAYAPPASAFDEPEPEPDVAARTDMPRASIDWAGRLGVAAGWAGLAALIFVIGWSGMRFRQQIATLWPQSASLYAALGKPVNTSGLSIRNVEYRNLTEDGQPILSITGRLTNIASREVIVPPIRVTLTDDDKRVLYNWTFSTSAASLKPGQTVNFVTKLSSPPSGARHLQVRLAESAK